LTQAAASAAVIAPQVAAQRRAAAGGGARELLEEVGELGPAVPVATSSAANTAFSGGQAKAHNIADLRLQLRVGEELERLRPPGLTPYLRHVRATVASLMPSWPASAQVD
jgi:hypothetical protein